MDRLETKNIICGGGLNVILDVMQQAENAPGTARELINYEPAEGVGYSKVKGYIKWDSLQVPGDGTEPVLGVQPALGGVFAVRKTGGSVYVELESGTGHVTLESGTGATLLESAAGAIDYGLYFSSGSGWTKINSPVRSNAVSKARFHAYSIIKPSICLVDGANYAAKYDGTTYTLLNGTGAPTDPSYAADFLERLVLAGHDNGDEIILSAPTDDTKYTAGAGAIAFKVGDVITGLASFRGFLYILCQNSIRRLQGETAENFQVITITEKIGCISGDTIQEVGGDIIFLAPDGFRSLAATEKIGDVELGIQSRQINPFVIDMISNNPLTYASCVIPTKSQYRCFYHVGSIDDNSQKGFVGKYRPSAQPTGEQDYEWGRIQGFPSYCSGHRVLDSDEYVAVFGHHSNGYVYLMESGGSFDGVDIAFIYKTPPFIFSDINIRKVIHRIRAIVSPSGNTSINLAITLDEYEFQSIQPSAKILDIRSSGAQFGVAVFGIDVFALDILPTIVSKKLEGSGNTITFKFYGANSDDSHTINAFALEYAAKGRRVGENS